MPEIENRATNMVKRNSRFYSIISDKRTEIIELIRVQRGGILGID